MPNHKFKVGDKVRWVGEIEPDDNRWAYKGDTVTIRELVGRTGFKVEENKRYSDDYAYFDLTDDDNCKWELVEDAVKTNNGFVVNEQGGMKGDGDKVRPTILLKDLNQSVQSVIRVLEYGAKKYSRANYAKVENERYEDALGRHYMAYLTGEKNDSETGESHLAHVVCCALFMMQKEIV